MLFVKVRLKLQYTTVFLIRFVGAVDNSVTLWVYLVYTLSSSTVIMPTAVPWCRAKVITVNVQRWFHRFNKVSGSGREAGDRGGDRNSFGVCVAQDPVSEFGHTGINPGFVDLSAAHTPAHHTR